jgi:NAD(P)-dependent dehydrogenase (short-subunit alcohol dehydrogenase family)
VGVLDRFDLQGRTAVVTGSTRGLGRTFALALAEAGASIVVVGRDAAAADGVEAELADRGAASRTVLADVTERHDVERVLAESTEAFGRVDVLVNNAGACVHKPALDVTDDEWRHVMSTNLDGLWIVSQVFGRHMVERGGGTIVNIGSMSALDRQPSAVAAGVQRVEGRRAPADQITGCRVGALQYPGQCAGSRLHQDGDGGSGSA